MTAKRIYVVDDDPALRDSLSTLLRVAGYETETFESAKAFLANGGATSRGCVIADVRMPDMDGLELQEELVRRGAPLSVIIVTGHADVPLAVRAMKAGAIDFIEKPFDADALLESVSRAFATLKPIAEADVDRVVEERFRLLTDRERQVLEQIVDGHANKVIAYHLSISPRTVELHRARVMDKMAARGVAELVRMALPILRTRNNGKYAEH